MARRPSDESADPSGSRWRLIWRIVARVPHGRVATYGQIAALAGLPGHARQVGYALAALPEGSAVPWQRIVNARGEISLRATFDGAPRQRLALQDEGIRFDAAGRIDLKRYQWRPRVPPPGRGRGRSRR